MRIGLVLSEDGKAVINVMVLNDNDDPAKYGAVPSPSPDVGIGWVLEKGEWVDRRDLMMIEGNNG